MAAKIRLGILGSTKGTDLQAIIDAINDKKLDAQIVLVASDKRDAFILERAAKSNIATFSVDYKEFSSRADAEKVIVAELRKSGAELILLIGFMKILTPYFVGEFRGRIWNMHPSLLPKYASGMNLDVHRKVIENHEKESGCTLHEVTEQLDAGKIIMQKSCEVAPEETAESLKEKVQKLEQQCFLEALDMVANGKLKVG